MRSLSTRTPIAGRGYLLATQICGPLACNMFTLICQKSRDAVVIDPSHTTSQEFHSFQKHLEDNDAQLKHILLTHGHPDHVAGVLQALEQWPKASLHLHPNEEENYYSAHDMGNMFGVPVPKNLPSPTHTLSDGDILQIGQTIELSVVHTPGHAPGHVAFVDTRRPMPQSSHSKTTPVDKNKNSNDGSVLISGDLLFRGSVGRTDHPNASVEDLFASLRRLYDMFDDESIVLSGHTTPTYLKRERKTNPFVDMALKRPQQWYEEAKERNGWIDN